MDFNKNLEKGFFGFWVRKYKVSFLAIFLILSAGLFSLFTIPKESSPDIKFGIISINTVYVGVNPNDMDSLVTEKIENEVENIDGIKKINSTSSVGMSSTVIELHNDIDVRNALTDIKDAVDKVSLPEDAEEPSVIELSSSNELMFEVLLYGPSEKYSQFDLIQASQVIKSSLEGSNGIASIELKGADIKGGLTSGKGDYEIKILLDKEKIELLDLSLRDISNVIKSYNKNTPIGNYTLGELNYDYRFDGELENIEELKNIVIKGKGGSYVLLKDISKIEKKYKGNEIKKLGFYKDTGYNYTSLIFNKAAGVNVFSVSDIAKESIEDFMKGDSNFRDLKIMYTKDMSELIIEDYDNLSKTAMQTIVLVFITILIFVGLRESIIASMLIPLAFLVTFIILDLIGLSLNFLTNFSLVLTLGIAIDTVIVIIEGASENIKLGYRKHSAILIAVRDYRSPLISGTLTTLVAFLPLMFLPGVMGKFLAYIPITVFTTLIAALVLSLTVGSALFIKFIHESKYFSIDKKLEESFSKNQTEFLSQEREGKIELTHEKTSFRHRILNRIGNKYYDTLKSVIQSRKSRWTFILTPIILLILTFIFISPKLGFTLFPAADNAVINGTIEAKVGIKEKSLEKYLPILDNIFDKYSELKVYYTTIIGNKIDIYIELLERNIRKEKNMRSVFEIEALIVKDIKKLESEGLFVSLQTLKEGPPTGKAIGIKLIANNSKKVEELKKIANIFKEKLKSIPGAKNADTSGSETPGQFIFEFNRDKLSEIGLIPDDILSEVYFYTSGVKAGSIKSEYEDNDIVLKIEDFDENLSPDDINNLIVHTRVGKIRVGDFATYKFTKAVSSISREKGKISITVDADVEFGKLPTDVQPLFLEYAENYNYPEGISFSVGGENEENMDLIVSTIKSLFISIFLIFSILVFQFNSFAQPAIVLYSVILALLGVNLGLYATGNPYSMTFGIGFIALTGVVVNDAIILIDRINKNLAKGIDSIHAVISAGKTRLQPIIVTTLTTIFGVLPIALQDEFWAGLGFTIVFGLFAGSTMTLFVIPSLYYEVFLRKKKNK